MIKARYDDHGNIILDLKLIGRCGDKKVKVLMDTGFSGALAIPVSIGCEIGLESVGDAHVIVASGEAIPVPIFLGKVEIGEDKIESIFIVLPGSEEVLIGMEILKDFNVEFHGVKRLIKIKKAEAEAAKSIEEIELSIAPPPTLPIPIPPAPLPPSEASGVPVAPTPTDRMQTLKETLREVVPR